MTPQEREDRLKEQVRRAKAKYKDKLKSSAPKDVRRKTQHIQRKRMTLALKETPDSKRDKVNKELNDTV
jgi:hypothetical protein